MQSAVKQAASFYMNDNKRKKIIQLILPAVFVAFFAMLSLIGVYKCPLDAFLGKAKHSEYAEVSASGSQYQSYYKVSHEEQSYHYQNYD